MVISPAADAKHYCLVAHRIRPRRLNPGSTLEMRLAALCLAALAVAAALSAPAAGTKAKRVLVPIADGTEEIEVVTVADAPAPRRRGVALASVEEEGPRRVQPR